MLNLFTPNPLPIFFPLSLSDTKYSNTFFVQVLSDFLGHHGVKEWVSLLIASKVFFSPKKTKASSFPILESRTLFKLVERERMSNKYLNVMKEICVVQYPIVSYTVLGWLPQCKQSKQAEKLQMPRIFSMFRNITQHLRFPPFRHFSPHLNLQNRSQNVSPGPGAHPALRGEAPCCRSSLTDQPASRFRMAI